MKRLNVTDKSACAACYACEIACSTAFYKKYDQELSCIKITDDNGEPKILNCIQCGKCAEVCEYGAITQNKQGVYMLNKKECKQCFKCVDVCPTNSIVKSSEDAAPSKCTACSICVKACPMGILEIKESVSV